MWLLATFGRLSIELIRYDFRDDAQRGLRCHAKTARIFVITALKRAMKETHGAVVKGSEEVAASFDSARFLLREVVEASLILLPEIHHGIGRHDDEAARPCLHAVCLDSRH